MAYITEKPNEESICTAMKNIKMKQQVMTFCLKGKNVIKLKSIFASLLFLVSASYLSG